MTSKHRGAIGVALGVVMCASASAAEPSPDDELAMAFGDKSVVSIATGTQVATSRAPAVATVFTAADIAAMGATDLEQVLETVPGLHVLRATSHGFRPQFVIRGIGGIVTNPQLLMLMNGVPMTSVYSGDRGLTWGGLPLENIARIEVIRGPGSAVYGADAFSGVVNLITKTADQIGGTELGARVGSFDSAWAWALHGTRLGSAKVAAYLGLARTDGDRSTVPIDAQSGLDAALGTDASLAPGPVSLGRDMIDGQIDVSLDRWQWRLTMKSRQDMGVGAGVAQALDPVGREDGHRWASDLTYHDPNIAPDWDLALQASWMNESARYHFMLFPPGSTILQPFPDGMFGFPSTWERHWRLNATALYTGLADHRVRIGAGYENEALYKARELKNFALLYVPGVGSFPVPLGQMVDATHTAPFITPHSRRMVFAFLQDEWRLAPDWALTGGLRHDRYSDFGSTTNPRLALVWDAAYNVTAKLLYGRAFRAPAFIELYNINNPVALGNPALKPETIDSAEAAVSWQPTREWQLSVDVFRYRLRDEIRYVPHADPSTGSTTQNIGTQDGHGLELEAAWDASRTLRLSGNYAYQHSTDLTTHQDAGLAPRQHLYARADWRLASAWVLNAQVNHVAQRKRQFGDTRPPVPDYTTVDLTLRSDNARGGWEGAITVRNLFDADVREPSPAPGQIRYDLPMPGRTFYLQATYRL